MAEQVLGDRCDLGLLGGGNGVLVIGEVERLEFDPLDLRAEAVDVRGLAQVFAVGAGTGLGVESFATGQVEAFAGTEPGIAVQVEAVAAESFAAVAAVAAVVQARTVDIAVYPEGSDGVAGIVGISGDGECGAGQRRHGEDGETG